MQPGLDAKAFGVLLHALAPDEPDAHEAVHRYITILMDKLIAAKWFLKDLEVVALEWLAGKFTGRAAEKWTRVVAAARITATTSGIGHNSVLYRCLRDMVLAYQAVGIKAHLQLRKLRDLVWSRKDTVAQTASKVLAFFEAYDRAVELTRHLGVTLQVPAQDFATRFTEMQGAVGSWRRWAKATEGWSVKERRSLSEVKERLLQAGKA